MPRPTKDEIHFLLLKIHSLTGILPIGAFLVIHLFINWILMNVCGLLLVILLKKIK